MRQTLLVSLLAILVVLSQLVSSHNLCESSNKCSSAFWNLISSPASKISYELDNSHSLPLKIWILFEQEKCSLSQCITNLNLPNTLQINAKSELLHGISVIIPQADFSVEEQQKVVKAWISNPFVREVEKVAVFTRPNPKPSITAEISSVGATHEVPLTQVDINKETNLPILNLQYGNSRSQIEQMNVLPLHQEGYYGDNITIVVLDSGFRTRHSAFSQMTILDTYDFINNDANVDDNDSNQIDHGTKCLSLIGGLHNNYMIGPAFRAKFLLAKTENVYSETSVEEDNFVRAMEWGMARGAQILSASLGYSDWYTRSQLDGQTAITTRAVNAAVSRGLIAVIANGNAGASGIGAPADAVNSISVGAIDSADGVASFSSRGPTADGRIKPEISARGVQNWIVIPSGSIEYTTGSGTSFATPLVAGAVALIKQKKPKWSNIKIREAIISTGRRPNNGYSGALPNNEYGYGVIDVAAATNTTESALENCLSNCVNGFCRNSVCVCYTGYTGTTCSLPTHSGGSSFISYVSVMLLLLLLPLFL